MDQSKVKRITVKLKSPNPLFEKWLLEWKNKAKENDSKMQYTFNIAIKSLQKYPIPLNSGRECMILKGFGNKLCEMLDTKLKEHMSNRLSADTTVNYEYVEEITTKTKKKKTPKKSPKANSKPYVPTHRSGAYAILVTLLNKSQEPDFPGFMIKQELVKHARDHCDKSFTKAEPGSFYTAWSSMATLVSKKLIEKKSSPPKYSLTPEGFDVACKLIDNSPENDQNNCNNKPSTSTVIVTDENEKISNSPIMIDYCTSNKLISSEKSVINEKKQEETISSQSSSKTETILFAPGSFDIILLVDNQETEGSKTNELDDDTKYELNRTGVKYEIRHMKVGDFTWICRQKDTQQELVLPYIVERKRLDDLAGSIKDGRFHEQKGRLKQCGMKNLIYVVERIGRTVENFGGLPLTTLMQAATNTLVQDGFQLKFTTSHKNTMSYLAQFTKILQKYYYNKTIMVCGREDLIDHSFSDDLVSMMSFKEFNKGASKQKDMTVKEMFIKQLIQLKGLSVDKAIAITEKYPTVRLLIDEYEKVGPKIGPTLLAKIQYGPWKRAVGAVISKTLHQLYTQEQLL